MKNKILLLFTVLITTISFAQIGFNYKALIKDNLGNVVTNQEIDIRFSLEYDLGVEFGIISVYQELHTVTTSNNGIVILNIGEGTAISGTFPQDGWTSNTYMIVEIDLNQDGTFVNLGTTDFKMVPMAISARHANFAITANTANNVTGLEQITEGGNTGWRLVGTDPNNFGPIGSAAIDLSYSNNLSETKGATGENSTALGRGTHASELASMAMGISTTASGFVSTAMGFATTASGPLSTAMGDNTTASGAASTAMGTSTTASGGRTTAMGIETTASGELSTALGFQTKAESYISTAIGRFNIGGATTNGDTNWFSTDPLFEVGNGNSDSNRNNALTIYKNGNAKFDAEIQNTSTGDANLIPIAYGTVESTGNVRSGTGNFTASLNSGVLSISVNGQTLTVDNSSCLITTYSTAFRTSSLIMSGGDIDVRIFDSSGNLNPTTFQFTIYKL